ncbi:ceramide kinase-like [Uloborus diversus]|uniref:ceramide kinase-like n=1 Tax=Uloborus diversus TaxID=327109 RepID=UPI0024097396|nr:ceramide kinase-like [Uloborus diversus]
MATRGNNEDGNFVLSGNFITTKGSRIHLVLTKAAISWVTENSAKPDVSIPLRHLIAVNPCDCSGLKPTKPLRCYQCRTKQYHVGGPAADVLFTHAKSLRLHYAVPFGRHMWRLDSQVFRPLEDTRLKEWIEIIQDLLLELTRPKRLLIFVNPYGGKKKGVKIFEQKVSPILLLAGIEAHVVVTQRANHAKEMIEDIDILKYDGIVCVGGDGMFSEILNGTLLKTQKEKGLDLNDLYNSLMVPRIPLGIIPAGSTNAAANCITGSCDPVSATLLIIMGDSVGVDVCGVYSSGQFLRFVITFLSYGYFGDVIRDSEKLRWMGPKRYDFSGFKKILCRKLYEGELQLQVDVPLNRSSWENDLCGINCETCSVASHKSLESENSVKKMKWLTVRGRFIGVNAAIMSCACYMSSKGISPSQHLGNGYCDVILVSSCSRLNYLRYLLRTSYHHSNPFDLNFVQVYRVREFRFNPFVTDDKTPATGCAGLQDNWQEMNTSVWNCDGEVVAEPALTSRVHCQLINVFGRGFENRKPRSTLSSCFNFMKS